MSIQEVIAGAAVFGQQAYYALLFKPRPFVLGEIVLDDIISEQVVFSSDVPESPVEVGAVVNDHIIARPASITLEGRITDSPIEYFAGIVRYFQNGALPSTSSYQALRWAERRGTPISVVTRRDVFPLMVITEFQANDDVDSAGMLRYRLSLKEWRSVYAATGVMVPPVESTAGGGTGSGDKATAPPSKGNQGTAEVKNKETILHSILEGLGIL